MKWEAFKICRNEVTNRVNMAKQNFENKVIQDIQSNPKSFWNYVNYKTKVKTGIQGLENENGDLVNDDTEKAEILNEHFSSVFTVEDMSSLPNIRESNTGQSIEEVEFDQDSILNLIEKQNVSKAAGPDGVHAKVLYECKNSLSKALDIIFNKSLESGNLPSQWKDAHVKPLFKKGKKRSPKNYRPVSLTSICSKLLEKIVRNAIVKHLESLGILTKDQHGFREGRSCNTQLLEIMEIWTDFLEKGLCWDCIYLDFAKAFDSVPHQRLLLKVKNYGIKGKLLNWIQDFLYNRKQRVIVGKGKSSWTAVRSGIPQGSVLGPLLFVIFINDLPEEIKSQIKIFADDTKIFRALSQSSEITVLQDDLNKLALWSKTWQLPFNEKKCKIIHYGKKNPNHIYQMNNENLESVTEEKDLGVTFDRELKFRAHIRNIVSRANSRVGIIKRSFETLTEENFKILYKSQVRPILDYCSDIWYPSYIKDMSEIEKVQKRATKLVKGFWEKTYNERLKELDLPTMEYRRNRTDMIQVFRIIKGHDNIDPNMFFELDKRGKTRGHSLKLIKQRMCTRS